jgi:Chaperone of endosialidase
MNSDSEILYRLKPVTYRYKKEIDPTQSLAFGLIAEEVAKVNPDLVACNTDGQPESVHYEMVNALLLNEFLKEHRKSEQDRATIGDLKKQIATLTATIKQQAAQIEKVSAQVQVSSHAGKVVANKP